MTSAQASRIVLVSGAGMATFVLIQASKQRRPSETTYKSLWAVGLLTIGMSIFADFVPKVAGPFAILVLIAMGVRNTGAVGGVIGKGSGTGSAKKQTGPPAKARETNTTKEPPHLPRGN